MTEFDCTVLRTLSWHYTMAPSISMAAKLQYETSVLGFAELVMEVIMFRTQLIIVQIMKWSVVLN